MATTLIDVPLSGQTLGQTRVPIRTNFTVISDAFQVDHVAYNASGQGKHKWVTFPVQTQATAQAALIYPDIGLYSALYATTGINELFFRNSGNVVPDVPMTARLYAGNGWTYLPSGIIIQWGVIATGANPSPVTFPIAFPNACFKVVASATDPGTGGAVGAANPTTVGFSARAQSGAAVNGSYIAIGY